MQQLFQLKQHPQLVAASCENKADYPEPGPGFTDVWVETDLQQGDTDKIAIQKQA